MTNLVSAYQRRDVHEAEKILRGALSPLLRNRSQRLTTRRRQPRHDHGRPLHPRLHRRRPPLPPHSMDPRNHQALHLHRDHLPRSRAFPLSFPAMAKLMQ